MIKSWRPLAFAAAMNLSIGAGIAAAQTVLVTHAPVGETVEVVLNATKVSSGTVELNGAVTLSLDLSRHPGKNEIDANVFVDTCEKLHRITVVERSKAPDPQQPGCARRDIPGLYWVRRLNTLVVDLGSATPTMLLVKGSYSLAPPREWTPSPAGLVVFGGGGLLKFSNALLVSCGNVTDCDGHDLGAPLMAGVTYWFNPILGVEASYVKPRQVTGQGSAETYQFNSSLDAHIATIVGKVGIPMGPFRLYGQGGLNYHRAKFTTTETINDLTITVNDVPQTITGGTQQFSFETQGWRWTFGGGAELWLAPSFALYGDFGFAALRGKDIDRGEPRLDDRVRFIAFGARVHIGR